MAQEEASSLTVLKVIAQISRALLEPDDPSAVLKDVLAKLGGVFSIDRVYVFKNRVDEASGRMFTTYYLEWIKDGIKPQITSSMVQDVAYDEFLPRWFDTMLKGDYIIGNVKDFPKNERWLLEPQSIKSLLTVPIIFKNVFWGFVGFDDCTAEREWTQTDIQTLTTASNMISSFIIRNKIKANLEENEQRWLKALEGSGEGVWDYDIPGNKIYISPKGKALLGRYNEELHYIDINFLLNSVLPDDKDRTVDFFKNIVKDPASSISYEFRHIVNGKILWFYAKGAVVSHGAFGEPARIIGTFSDITERKHFDEKLREALLAAETANRAKSSFLATMSHEIRTPLNGMVGFLRLLGEHITDETGLEYLRIIDNSTGTLLNIINSILDLSKVESGNVILENVSCNLHEELESIARLFSASAYEKIVYLRTFIDPNIPILVKCDQLRIRQVLSNLLNNALKFTPKNGFIYFDAEVLEKSDGHVHIKFSIKDTGIGISESAIKDIFKPFTQADSSVSRKFGGSGLGLTIAYKFVELMGGEIRVSSVPDQGSNFYFVLKFKIEEEIIKATYNQHIAFIEYPKCTWSFSKNLASLGFTPTPFENAGELIKVDISEYYAVLLSVFYVDQNILDDLQILRGEFKDIPIILLSYPVDVSVFDVLKSLKVMVKIRPFSALKFAKFIDSIKKINASDYLSVMLDEPKIYSGNILVAEDNIVNSRLISIILTKYGLNSKVVGNGQEAIIAMKDFNYDLILMDVNMPIMDGMTATREIRRCERENGYDKKPIVALTANVMKEDAIKFIEAGMDGVLSKPIEYKALEDIFNRFLKTR